jgi:dsDNA-specific endonuclease/ATPase MutS2
MNHTFQTLEFNRILEKLESFSHTEAAKELIRNLTPTHMEREERSERYHRSQNYTGSYGTSTSSGDERS